METIATLGERVLRRLGVAVVPPSARPALAVIIPAATIATNALIALAVIASDETPSASDQALALAKVSAIHDGLVSQAIVAWTLDAIPRAVSEEYTQLTALHLATAFGKTGDPAAQPVIEARIRHVVMTLSADSLATEAVQGVHNDLAMRGRVRWSVWDIPAAVADQYAILAAATLAPQFNVKTDPREAQAASIALARYIALPSSGETVIVEYF